MPMRVPAIVLVAVLGIGCHRLYEIRGTILVAREAVHDGAVPEVLCSGHGGPLETSGVYGRPVSSPGYDGATVFCGRLSQPIAFPLHESIYYGSVPRRAHVYAWLAPVPGAQEICKRGERPIVRIGYQALDELMSPVEAKKPLAGRTFESRPCGKAPTRSMPLDFAITFDPDHPTWTETDGGRWIEERNLRIK